MPRFCSPSAVCLPCVNSTWKIFGHFSLYSLIFLLPQHSASLGLTRLGQSILGGGQFVFGSVNNTHLIPLLPRLPALSCISLISSPAPQTIRKDIHNHFLFVFSFLFVCPPSGWEMEPVLESINLEDLSYHRRDRGSLSDYQGSVMDRVKNRSETKSNRGCRYLQLLWCQICIKLLSL